MAWPHGRPLRSCHGEQRNLPDFVVRAYLSKWEFHAARGTHGAVSILVHAENAWVAGASLRRPYTTGAPLRGLRAASEFLCEPQTEGAGLGHCLVVRYDAAGVALREAVHLAAPVEHIAYEQVPRVAVLG